MPENTEKTVKDTEQAVNAEKPAKTEKSDKNENKKENVFVRFFKNTGKFLRDVKNEVKKIVWPTPKSVFKNTGVVLVTIIVVGLVIFGLDTAFMNLLGLIMNIA